MRVLPIILMLSLLSLSACEKEIGLEINDNTKQVIFVSDEANQAELQKEVPYYDAIIELRKQFPTEFKEMITITPNTAKEYDKTFKVDNSPALLVLYKKQVVGIVDGDSSKEKIIDTMQKALSE